MKRARSVISVMIIEFIKKFTGELYIIALPAIAAALQASRESVQILLTFFFAGIAIAQFFAGPLSDHVGRQKMLLLTLPLFSMEALVAGFSHHLWQLYIGMTIMGLGIVQYTGAHLTVSTIEIMSSAPTSRSPVPGISNNSSFLLPTVIPENCSGSFVVPRVS